MEFIEALSIFVVLFIVWLLFFRRKKEKPKPVVDTNVMYFYSDWELRLLKVINEYRKADEDLMVSDYISTLCMEHNFYMIEEDQATHDYVQTRLDRIKDNLGAIHAGEIIADGYHTAESVLSAFLHSPDHKDIVENLEFNYVGLSKRNEFVTVIFAEI